MAAVSFMFDAGNRTVWSPASRVGDLYVRFMNQLGDAFQLANGLTPMAADYYNIDPDVFEAFVTHAFAENFRSAQRIGRGMVESVLAPSIVILDRISRPLTGCTEEETAFITTARMLSMPQ
jgi:hypothetical protein